MGTRLRQRLEQLLGELQVTACNAATSCGLFASNHPVQAPETGRALASVAQPRPPVWACQRPCISQDGII